jgi:hypothetical protein
MGLVKLFWAWGYVADINVKLFYPGGVGKTKAEMTDVDVLGHKVTHELVLHRVAGDCKTARGISPISRAFWLSGVMQGLNVDRGYVVLSRTSEVDHKIAAQTQGITLLSDDELGVLIRAVLPPTFPHDMHLFQSAAWKQFYSEGETQASVTGLWQYRRNRLHQDPYSTGVRQLIAETRQHKKAFEQKNRILSCVFGDVLTGFAFAFVGMLADLFRVYLVVDSKAELDQQLKAYVYGGQAAYQRLNSVTQQLLQLRAQLKGEASNAAAKEALALPEWERFLQLFRAALAAPVPFFAVPRVLRFVLWERVIGGGSGVDVADALPEVSNHAVKCAGDILGYFAAASRVPDHTWLPLRDALDGLLVQLPSAAAQAWDRVEVASMPGREQPPGSVSGDEAQQDASAINGGVSGVHAERAATGVGKASESPILPKPRELSLADDDV